MTEENAPATATMGFGPTAIAIGVGAISLALMLTQIILTRIFSVIVWYHFAFFAISVALLGLGASGMLVYALLPRLRAEHAPAQLALGSLAFGAGVLSLPLFLLNVSPDWFGAGGSASLFTAFTPKLLAVFAVTALPFFLGGGVIALAFARWPEAIHRNYAFDLVGAALACALVIPLLDRWGAPRSLIAPVGVAGLAAISFGLAGVRRPRRLLGYALAGAISVGLGLGLAQAGWLELRIAKGLDLQHTKPEWNRWNSFSLVSVLPTWGFRGWGMSPTYTGPIPAQKSLVIDMNAFTSLTAFDGKLESVKHTSYDLSALAFRIHPAPARSCIVGAGGGKDVLAALAAGSREVTAVEVNPLIAEDVMRGAYGRFTGGLYSRPDVRLEVEDGRTFLRRSQARYDVILISMVDTSAATAAGAYALAENSLYTSSALRDFMSRLTPDGVLTVASVSLPGLAVGARLSSLARAALSGLGHDPARAVAVVRTPWLSDPNASMYNLLIKPAGFDERDLAALESSVAQLRFDAAYLPERAAAKSSRPITPTRTAEDAWIRQILTVRDDRALAAQIARWPLDVSPVDDDRPFFFYQNRLRDAPRALLSRSESHLFGNGLSVLLKVLVASLIMVGVCIGLPLSLATRMNRSGLRGASADLAYIGCIGLGYMFIEIACIQRLMPYLGTPTHALTAVLLVLLLAGGIGSRLSASASPRAVSLSFACLIGYALALGVLWSSIASASAGTSVAGRGLVAAVCLAPLGLLMGVPLPSALAAVQRREASRVPWLWAVNGAASVLGSVAATVGSMHAGISLLLAAGIGLYLAAALLWQRVGTEPIR